jgi:hypothetical protein
MGWGSGIPDSGSGKNLSRIPNSDPGVKKAPNPVSGFATLSPKQKLNMELDLQRLFGLHVTRCAQLFSLAETRGLQGDVVYLSWPIAPLLYEPYCGGGGVVSGSQPMRTAVHITWHGAQINFGELTPYLTCDWNPATPPLPSHLGAIGQQR